MRIAYISYTCYADVDLSFVNALQKYADVDYYIIMHPKGLRQTALDLSNSKMLTPGINKATDLIELDQFKGLIKLENTYIVYHTGLHAYSYQSISEAFELFRYVKRKHYDIVHITNSPSLSQLFFYSLRSKIVLTVHDPFPHSSLKNKLEKLVRKMSYRILNNFILLNKAQRDKFISVNHLEKKNVFNSHLSSYKYLTAYLDSNAVEGKYILFFGNIVSYKGVEYLMYAMKKVHEELPNLKLVVAGKGNFYFNIDEFQGLEFIEIRNRFIPNDELATLIKYSELVAVPYIDATQSGVIMSAYAFNKPCIVTEVGGLPEMVGYGEMGVVVKPKNVDELSSAIVNTLKDGEMLSSFSKKIADKYGNGELSWDATAKEHLNFYKKILNANE